MTIDISPNLFGEATSSDSDRLRTQLAAVRLLVVRTDRDVAHHDILIATMFEVLERGPLTVASVKDRVRQAWPSLRLEDAQWDAAISAAVAIDCIRHDVGPGGTATLVLCAPGRDSLLESQEWASGCLVRFYAQLTDELRNRRCFTSAVDVENLGSVVIAALRRVVSDAFKHAAGTPVTELGGWLRVAGPNTAAIEDFVSEKIPDSERADLAGSLVRVCLDQSNEIGNEIVHQLIKGHLLYQFMGRPDAAIAAPAAGSLAGEKLILDTPILVRLLGPNSVKMPVLALLTTALKLDMEVVLYERTRTELEGVLDSTALNAVPDLEQALRKGSDPALLAAMTRSDEVATTWLKWCIAQPHAQRTWAAWRGSAAGDGALFTLLDAIGITVRKNESYGDSIEAPGRLIAFETQLGSQIARNGLRPRNSTVLHHDAMNLLDVWFAREQNPSSTEKVWPGAFVLSPDGQINETYDEVLGKQTFPAALTFSQFAQIVGSYANPSDSERFADDIAGGVADQLLLARAANVPAEVVRDIAQALSPEPLSYSEAEQLQLELRRSFDFGRRSLEAGSPDNVELAGAIADRMRERRRAASRESIKATTDETRRRELAEARLGVSESLNQRRLEDAETESRRLAEVLRAKELKEASDEQARADEASADRRGRWIERAGFGIVLVTVVQVITGHGTWAIATALTAVSVFVFGKEWAKKRMNAGVALLSIAALVFTVAPYVQAFFTRK